MAPLSASTLTPVPFLDLGAIHEPLKEPVLAGIGAIIDASSFINGPQVAEFERAFAAFCGTSDAVGLASGLDALRLALIAAGLQPGDEVVVPANTFVATFEAISQAGGVPVPVDVSEADWNLDIELADAALSERTRFVLPVHLYGQLADMRAVTRFSQRHGLQVLEDACQAHGAERDGFRAGAGGFAGAFSFYPGKNLGAFGDAGALATNDGDLAARVRALREHGQRAKYEHELEGWTARMDTIQALVLLHKLDHLEGWNQQRAAAAGFYTEALADYEELVLPPVAPNSDPVWHLYVIRAQDPLGLADFLRERGVATGRHYPQPPHLSPAYRHLGYGEGAFPVSEGLARECLSLPIFPGMTDEELEAVVDGIAAYFSRG